MIGSKLALLAMPLRVIFDIAQLVKIFVTEVAFEELVKTSSDWIALVKPLKIAG